MPNAGKALTRRPSDHQIQFAGSRVYVKFVLDISHQACQGTAPQNEFLDIVYMKFVTQQRWVSFRSVD
jgi:hypothetical protein